MIIGISGKIGSGKDTIGQIIQYLTNPHTDKGNYKTHELGFIESNWQIKKFAYKLKQITALLLGVSVEQLEDREFKEKELGEEWWYWSVYDGIEYKPQYFPTREEAEKRCDEVWGSDLYDTMIKQVKLTPRLILQLLGTEAGREIIHPNIWVNALMSEYNKNDVNPIKVRQGRLTALQAFNLSQNNKPKWIITDMRFPNELEAVKKRGGITIRVNRISDEAGQYEVKQHPSETALDNHKFDYVIDNSGSMSSLINKVKEICHEIKIL